MAEKDLKKLSHFFRTMMASAQTPIGYTVFGDKPMSFVECDEVEAEHLMRPYRTWKKYEKQIPMDNLCFRIQREPSDFGEAGEADIFIINKSEFLKTVANHISKFRAVLGNDITPEKLLNDYLNDESLILQNKLNNSEELHGLLFGLTTGDTQDADLPYEEIKILHKYFIDMAKFGPTDNHHYTKVILPQALGINGANPPSFSLVRKWKAMQPTLQEIVDIKDDRLFLQVIMRKWADASTFPTLPLHNLPAPCLEEPVAESIGVAPRYVYKDPDTVMF